MDMIENLGSEYQTNPGCSKPSSVVGNTKARFGLDLARILIIVTVARSGVSHDSNIVIAITARQDLKECSLVTSTWSRNQAPGASQDRISH